MMLAEESTKETRLTSLQKIRTLLPSGMRPGEVGRLSASYECPQHPDRQPLAIRSLSEEEDEEHATNVLTKKMTRSTDTAYEYLLRQSFSRE